MHSGAIPDSAITASSSYDSASVGPSNGRSDLLLLLLPYYSAPDRGAEYCDERVCLSVSVCVCVFVCPRSCLRNYTPRLHQIFMLVTYGRDSVFPWRRTDTLFTSGFLDDVIFAHKPRLLDVAAQLERSAHAALGLVINCAH